MALPPPAPPPAAAARAEAKPSEKVELAPGSQTLLAFPGVTRVALGDPSIAEVKVEPGGQLLLTGLAEGRTTLLVWRGRDPEKREVVVVLGRARRLQQQLDALLVDPLTVEEVNGSLLVRGRLTSTEQLSRLQTIVSDERDVKLLVELPRAARQEQLAEIDAALRAGGITRAHAVRAGDQVFIEGEVEDPVQARKAQAIVEALLKR